MQRGGKFKILTHITDWKRATLALVQCMRLLWMQRSITPCCNVCGELRADVLTGSTRDAPGFAQSSSMSQGPFERNCYVLFAGPFSFRSPVDSYFRASSIQGTVHNVYFVSSHAIWS